MPQPASGGGQEMSAARPTSAGRPGTPEAPCPGGRRPGPAAGRDTAVGGAPGRGRAAAPDAVGRLRLVRDLAGHPERRLPVARAAPARPRAGQDPAGGGGGPQRRAGAGQPAIRQRRQPPRAAARPRAAMRRPSAAGRGGGAPGPMRSNTGCSASSP
jgi:translation initiation factor IF-2